MYSDLNIFQPFGSTNKNGSYFHCCLQLDYFYRIVHEPLLIQCPAIECNLWFFLLELIIIQSVSFRAKKVLTYLLNVKLLKLLVYKMRTKSSKNSYQVDHSTEICVLRSCQSCMFQLHSKDLILDIECKSWYFYFKMTQRQCF